MTTLTCTPRTPHVERFLDTERVAAACSPRWHRLAVGTADDLRSLRTVCNSAWSAHGLTREEAVRARHAMQVVDRIVRLHRADGLLAEQLRFVAHELVACAGQCAPIEVESNGPTIVGAAAAAASFSAEAAGLYVLTRSASELRRASVWPDEEPDFARGIELDEDDDEDDDDLDPLPDLRSPTVHQRRDATDQPAHRPANRSISTAASFSGTGHPCDHAAAQAWLHDWRGVWTESVRVAAATIRISPLTVVPFASTLARCACIRPRSLVWLAPLLQSRIDLRTRQEHVA